MNLKKKMGLVVATIFGLFAVLPLGVFGADTHGGNAANNAVVTENEVNDHEAVNADELVIENANPNLHVNPHVNDALRDRLRNRRAAMRSDSEDGFRSSEEPAPIVNPNPGHNIPPNENEESGDLSANYPPRVENMASNNEDGRSIATANYPPPSLIAGENENRNASAAMRAAELNMSDDYESIDEVPVEELAHNVWVVILERIVNENNPNERRIVAFATKRLREMSLLSADRQPRDVDFSLLEGVSDDVLYKEAWEKVLSCIDTTNDDGRRVVDILTHWLTEKGVFSNNQPAAGEENSFDTVWTPTPAPRASSSYAVPPASAHEERANDFYNWLRDVEPIPSEHESTVIDNIERHPVPAPRSHVAPREHEVAYNDMREGHGNGDPADHGNGDPVDYNDDTLTDTPDEDLFDIHVDSLDDIEKSVIENGEYGDTAKFLGDSNDELSDRKSLSDIDHDQNASSSHPKTGDSLDMLLPIVGGLLFVGGSTFLIWRKSFLLK